MIAPRVLRILCIAMLVTAVYCTDDQKTSTPQTINEIQPKKIELFEGVFAKLPEVNNTDKLISFEVSTDTGLSEEGRSKKGKKKGSKKLLQKILPLFIMPFVIQSAIIPIFLGFLKFMLFKSLMVGKFALALILLNAFKNSNSFKGRDAEMANVHYGYHGQGMEEYGAYIN